jgi:hypothetical protein
VEQVTKRFERNQKGKTVATANESKPKSTATTWVMARQNVSNQFKVRSRSLNSVPFPLMQIRIPNGCLSVGADLF